MTNSKTIAKTKENRLNQNGSLSKTDQRKLKPISFCLLDTEQVTMLEKIEKFQYGNFFKNIIASMTDGYDCYQNALAERINGILKQEFLIYKCKSGNELNQLIKESVECYNTKRPHLSLNMKTPNFVYEKTSEVNFTGFN